MVVMFNGCQKRHHERPDHRTLADLSTLIHLSIKLMFNSCQKRDHERQDYQAVADRSTSMVTPYVGGSSRPQRLPSWDPTGRRQRKRRQRRRLDCEDTSLSMDDGRIVRRQRGWGNTSGYLACNETPAALPPGRKCPAATALPTQYAWKYMRTVE